MPPPQPWTQHQHDEDGDHDPDTCYACLLQMEVGSQCRCGECCRNMIVEALPEDADREPKIKEFGSPIYTDPRLTRSGHRELEGYLLTRKGGCMFLSADDTCSIYATRPPVCRLFDCDEEKDRLLQMGILTPRNS